MVYLVSKSRWIVASDGDSFLKEMIAISLFLTRNGIYDDQNKSTNLNPLASVLEWQERGG